MAKSMTRTEYYALKTDVALLHYFYHCSNEPDELGLIVAELNKRGYSVGHG